jgi:outer membrane autotransporter protein
MIRNSQLRAPLSHRIAVLAWVVWAGTWCTHVVAAPVTAPDVATTAEDTPVEVAVLANDFEDDCFFCPFPLFQIASLTQPVNGTVRVVRGSGPDRVRYTPNSNFFGTDTFTYTALGFSDDESAPTTVTITVTPVNDPPDSVDDEATTAQGRAVTIAVLANDSDIEGDALSIASVSQPQNGTAVVSGTSVTYTPNAGFSGTDRFTYQARDASAVSSPATVRIVVTPNEAPTAVIAGGNRTIADSDRTPGENVRLDGSASSDPDGTIVAYQWFNAAQVLIASGPTVDVRLPDGVSQIRLVVTDDRNATGSSTVTLSIATPPPRGTLESLPDLTPNERSVARALDDLCLRLTQQSAATEGQSDLAARCDGIVFDADAARQTRAVSELGAQDLNAIRSQTLLLAREQTVGVLDRLMALQSGAQGLSAAPQLSLTVDGKTVPPDMLASAMQLFLNDADQDNWQPGGSAGGGWGFWMRGTLGSNEMHASPSDPGFEADQWGVTAGLDYRPALEQTVLGIALGMGESDATFNPVGEGGVDMTAWSLSLYAGVYPTDGFFYADGFLSYSQMSSDTERLIRYEDADGTVERMATGSTDGSTFSVGLGAGHDFLVGPVTVSPNVRFLYIDALVDGFTESGASGLDLVYDEQSFESATGSVGVRITAALDFGWMVLLPHFRGDAVWEFSDDSGAFGVRFANDPFAGTANSTPAITVTGEEPDQSYLLLAAGLAAQLTQGISAYVEYESLEGLDFLEASSLAFGLRVQYSFR